MKICAKKSLASIKEYKASLIARKEGTPSLIERFKTTEKELERIKVSIHGIHSTIFNEDENGEILNYFKEEFK